MALYTPVLVPPLSNNYGGLTAGTAPTVITPAGGGDSIQLIGSYVVIRFATAGTASVITFDSVNPSNQGQDTNITVTLTTTQTMKVIIDVDPRFKQVSGNVGYLNMTYTSVTTLTIEAEYIA